MSGVVATQPTPYSSFYFFSTWRLIHVRAMQNQRQTTIEADDKGLLFPIVSSYGRAHEIKGCAIEN
jgi:phosphatidylserine decarboxylase